MNMEFASYREAYELISIFYPQALTHITRQLGIYWIKCVSALSASEAWPQLRGLKPVMRAGAELVSRYDDVRQRKK